ncbi:hypothetical protein Hanom_Chr14g01319191 [Helianthus anomalus]
MKSLIDFMRDESEKMMMIGFEFDDEKSALPLRSHVPYTFTLATYKIAVASAENTVIANTPSGYESCHQCP